MAKTTDKKKGKVVKRKVKRTILQGRVYIQASYNNTIVSITDPEGNVISWSSAGANGFKGARKATPYAAQVAAENAAEKAKIYGLEEVDIFVKGVGTGRDQSIRGLIALGLKINSITDITPVPHNGCRKKKQRRV